MANILDKYGIKEVADVTFYDITTKLPVLYLDTLKVSTIEQTAEEAEARGGKGNPPLIVWDYGKEINVTLEDALFSAKSMSIMFGNGTTGSDTLVTKTFTYKPKEEVTTPWTDSAHYSDLKEKCAGFANLVHGVTGTPTFTVRWYKEEPVDGKTTTSTATTLEANEDYYGVVTFNATSTVISITPDSFPGTYKVVGDTYARSASSGKDEFFQFIIEKAKVQSENTITLEAEGDPSVFNLNLRVLRDDDGQMMKLVKYDI